MAELTAREQLLLELINRGRLDPAAEARRYGEGLNTGVSSAERISTAAKQALAPNEILKDAAKAHSVWMIANDVFDHTGSGGSTPGQRMAAAGYEFTSPWGRAENIAYVGATGTINADAEVYNIHRNLYLSPGHRTNTMDGDYRELGTGIETGRFKSGSTTFNVLMATENFVYNSTDIFITGVAIHNADGDNFYDIGEGRSGIDVAVLRAGAAAGSDTTASAGGYSAAVAPGEDFNVVFSGGDLIGSVTVTVDTNSINAKVDLIGTNKVASSASITLGEGAKHALLLGIANLSANGNSGNNVLTGNSGNNTLRGADGNDILNGHYGRDVMRGGSGNDMFDFNSTSVTGKTSSTADVISDFEKGFDKIDLSTIDASARSSGNQSFNFIGTGGFSGRAGQLKYSLDRTNDKTVVTGDTNGDKSTDFRIELTGLHNLSSSDFVL